MLNQKSNRKTLHVQTESFAIHYSDDFFQWRQFVAQTYAFSLSWKVTSYWFSPCNIEGRIFDTLILNDELFVIEMINLLQNLSVFLWYKTKPVKMWSRTKMVENSIMLNVSTDLSLNTMKILVINCSFNKQIEND